MTCLKIKTKKRNCNFKLLLLHNNHRKTTQSHYVHERKQKLANTTHSLKCVAFDSWNGILMKTNGKKLFPFQNPQKTYKNHCVVITIIRIIRKWMCFTAIYTIQSNSTISNFHFVKPSFWPFPIYCLFHCNGCLVRLVVVFFSKPVLCSFYISENQNCSVWHGCHYAMLRVTITLNLNMFVLNLVKWIFSLIISSWDQLLRRQMKLLWDSFAQ